MESKLRSLFKTLSWRTAALFITAGVSYAMTRKLAVALVLGTSDTLVKLVLFYLHERLWNVVPYGRGSAVLPPVMDAAGETRLPTRAATERVGVTPSRLDTAQAALGGLP